jgi:hypothetical protein
VTKIGELGTTQAATSNRLPLRRNMKFQFQYGGLCWRSYFHALGEIDRFWSGSWLHWTILHLSSTFTYHCHMHVSVLSHVSSPSASRRCSLVTPASCSDFGSSSSCLTTDGQSASLSRRHATIWDPRLILLSLHGNYLQIFVCVFS